MWDALEEGLFVREGPDVLMGGERDQSENLREEDSFMFIMENFEVE